MSANPKKIAPAEEARIKDQLKRESKRHRISDSDFEREFKKWAEEASDTSDVIDRFKNYLAAFGLDNSGDRVNEPQTYRDKRTTAAAKYRAECLNAKGEVECSECGISVMESRALRNAQELAREKVRKLDEGPICNACAASWRYSHHQDSEMELANKQTDSITAEDPNLVPPSQK